MKQRTFGRSGIKVSEIIFGAGSVGGILIHEDDATKREAIRRAIAGGINWIDTAAQYNTTPGSDLRNKEPRRKAEGGTMKDEG